MADTWRHTSFSFLLLKILATCDPLTDTDNDGYFDPGDYENNIAKHDGIIMLDPQNAEIYNLRGIEYYAMGQAEQLTELYERAIEDYSEAIRLNPQHAGAYNNRAEAYSKLGLQELAARDITKAKELGFEECFPHPWPTRAPLIKCSYARAR